MKHTLETWYSNIKKSNLGLNNKVKKKFDKVDAIDNVSPIQFEDPEVAHICHEHGVYTVDDADRVTSIKNWFSDNSNIKTFDEFKYFTGLKTIEDMDFSFCDDLQSITIPNSVTSIGDRAFEVCWSLKSINIPDGVTSIEYGTFYRCTSLQSVIIPNSVTSIKARAFRHCEALKSINIPNSVTSIEECAFIECSALQSITIPNSVTSIGGMAFYECTSLQSIIIPNSVTYIGQCAFGRCRSLQSITIPDSVTMIGGRVFTECKALKSINISKNCPVYDQVNDQIKEEHQIIQLIEPKVNEASNLGLNSNVKKKFKDEDTIENISNILFEDPEVERICHKHGVYTYDDAAKVLSIKGWFNKNKSIEMFNELKLFTGLKTIEEEAFDYCRSLQSVTIPNNVSSIEYGSFFSCNSLQSITIPDGVTSIGIYAFMYCESLQSVTIPDSVTSIGATVFYGCKSLKKVYMSSSCKAFKSIMSKIRESSKDAIIIDPNNQKLLKRAGLVESVVRESKDTNIANSQGQDVPEIGKHAENVYLPDCPFMIGKEQVDWFEYFQREKEKHTIKDVDDFIESAKKKTELIKESNNNLGLNNKVKKKFDKVDAVVNISNYVDLGLPSGTLWSKINYGANIEGEAGEYYNFDDARNLPIRLPSKKQFQELESCCVFKFDIVNGIKGIRLISKKNDASIFFPLVGYILSNSNTVKGAKEDKNKDIPVIGCYWSKDEFSKSRGNSLMMVLTRLPIYNPNDISLKELKLQIRDVINVANESTSLGLNKKISDKFKNDKIYADDVNDAIANDLLDNITFYKEIYEFEKELARTTGNFDHDITFGLGRFHSSYCIERKIFKDEMEHHIYLAIRSYSLRDFTACENSFTISICIESQVGFARHLEWNLNRKSYKEFDNFFSELSESQESPRSEKSVYFKTTKRALEQVKKFIELFCTHNLYIWKNSLRKEADRVEGINLNITNRFINYTSRDIKRMMVPILREIPSLPSEYQH